MKTLITAILLFFSSVVYGAPSSDSDMKLLMGCWNNMENRKWEYGFFEKFAIYQCDFWNYHSVVFSKNRAEVVLKKGNEILRLDIKFDSKSDTICTLSSPHGRKIKLIRQSSDTGFTTKDNTAFTDNGYRADSVTIIGYLRHAESNKSFCVSTPRLLTRKDNWYYANLDSLGRFRLTVPVASTTMVHLDCQDKGMCLSGVVEPQDTLFLYYDYANDNTRFMGNNARVNQEYSNYVQYLCSIDRKAYSTYNDLTDHYTFLEKNRRIYQEEKNVFENYVASHPFLSDKFIYFTSTDLTMGYARRLMQRHFVLRKNFNQEFFSPVYMQEVDQLFQQVPRLLTLSSSTIDFLDNYLEYYNSMDQINCFSGAIEIIRYLDETKRFTLTPQQRDDLIDYERGSAIAFAGKMERADSVLIDSLTLPYKVGLFRTDSLLKDTIFLAPLLQEYAPIVEELMELKTIKNELFWSHRIEVPLFVKDWMLAKIFYGQIQTDKKALCERSIALMHTMLNNEYFRNMILEQQEKYKMLTKQDMQYLESLKRTEHLKNSKDADSLFRQLIEPYKGKIIYLDIWGTWCAPCREEMTYAPALIKEMEGKEIVFMYLANNSPEKIWKNVIKENNLTGLNIVHYNLPDKQQYMLEQRFSLHSYPTYILIDHEGNIVDMNPPRPSQKELLVIKLKELLAKLKLKE